MPSIYRDMFAVWALALFCLMSGSSSAPLACEDLLRPLNQPDVHHLEGRRTLVAASLSDPEHLESFKRRDSVVINFANASESSQISFRRSFGFGDQCQYLVSNITLDGSSFVVSNLTITFLYTSCQDCLLGHFNNKPMKIQRLYLFSKRREVEQNEMEEFRAQSECLNLSPTVMMDPTKVLCPDQFSSDLSAHTEQETEGQKA